MAASRPVMVTEEVLKNELECPVCMEEPRLHLLPCAHRCCMPCVGKRCTQCYYFKLTMSPCHTFSRGCSIFFLLH